MALTRDQVVHEALLLVDEKGLEGLSLRALAARLDVQAPTLSWHVGNKSALLDSLSDAIMDEAIDAVPADDEWLSWEQWMLAAFIALRAALFRHRDGARIVSGARDSFRRADFSELAMATLVRHGVDLPRASLLVVTALRYTVGHVLGEQGADANPYTPDDTDFSEPNRFPNLTRGMGAYFAAGNTADDLFEDGVRLLIGLPARG